MSSKETASDKFKDWFYESYNDEKDHPVHALDNVMSALCEYIENLAMLSYVAGYEQAQEDAEGDSNESD